MNDLGKGDLAQEGQISGTNTPEFFSNLCFITLAKVPQVQINRTSESPCAGMLGLSICASGLHQRAHSPWASQSVEAHCTQGAIHDD